MTEVCTIWNISFRGKSSASFGIVHTSRVLFWAEANDNNEWNVTRLELEVSKEPNKRLVVKGDPTESEAE